MPRVIVNDAVARETGDLEIRVNDGPRSFRLRTPRAYNAFVDQLQSRTLDLLLIAASVFATDTQIRRGGDVRDALGAGWYRELQFVVPVLEVSFWRSNVDALVATLNFLTGDDFTFEFVQRQKSPRRQPTLALTGGVPQADEVILFSGGLDSLTGAFETLTSEPTKTVLLVTHHSAGKNAKVQTGLAAALQERFGDRVLWVPALGTLVGRGADETTQRSRSFLYAALGYAAASLVNASRVHFFENGIVSANLPIDRQVIATMATRTTHPLFLHRMERLLSAVARRGVSITNPYQRYTKAEVVGRLVRRGGAELIAKTNSCSGVRRRTIEHPHCGRCSQCLDRRFAILAVDASAQDPAENYAVELWRGARRAQDDRTMAVDWTRHARRLAKISYAEFRIAFAAELAHLSLAYPESSPSMIASDAFDLHRRHGEAVRRVVARAIEDGRWAAVDGDVPRDSLLAAVFTDAVGDFPAPLFPSDDATTSDTKEAPPMRLPPRPSGAIFPLRVALVPDTAVSAMWIAGLGRFKGKYVSLVVNLEPYHNADLAASLEPAKHSYVPTRQLGDPNTIGQHAWRCRQAIATKCARTEIAIPPGDPLVQSWTHHGYRIDPDVRFVEDLTDLPDWAGDASAL